MKRQQFTIEELVLKIRCGEIKLPEIQRNYVWKEEKKILDFIDSLYRGYPSGTILLWEPDKNENIPTRSLAVGQEENTSETHLILLDGQQRLTTLFAIFSEEVLHVGSKKRPIRILFNLEHPDDFYGEDASDTEGSKKSHKEHTFAKGDLFLETVPYWVPVSKVLNTDGDDDFLRQCEVLYEDDPRYNKYKDRLKRLREIKTYKYVVDVLDQNTSYEEVTDIFNRINTGGIKLSTGDIALAQITVKWRGSRGIFEEFQEQCKDHGFKYDLVMYIRNLVSFASGQSNFKVLTSLQKSDLERYWKYSKDGFKHAINFLKGQVGIDNSDLINAFFLITIGYYAHRRSYSLTPEELDKLRYWFLVAAAKGRYSIRGTVGYLDQDLRGIKEGENISYMIDNLRKQFEHLEIKDTDIEGQKSKSLYFKMMFLAFQKDGARDWDGLNIDPNYLGAKNKLEIHHIFPKKILKDDNFPTKEIDDIANLSFVSAKTNNKIAAQSPAEYLESIINRHGKESLESQCIPTDRSLWQIDRYDDFLKERRRLIVDRLNAFIGHPQ